MKSIKTNPNSAKEPDKGKAFAHVQNCLLMKKAHGTNRIVEEQTH
jgi:hypothetical protein